MVKWIHAELDERDHERQEEMIKLHSRCWIKGSWRSEEVGRPQFTRKGEDFYIQHCFTDRVGVCALFVDSTSLGLVTGIAHGDTFHN